MLGYYSEEAQESLHKILRKTCEKHTDKSNRKSTIETLMLLLARASDSMLIRRFLFNEEFKILMKNKFKVIKMFIDFHLYQLVKNYLF